MNLPDIKKAKMRSKEKTKYIYENNTIDYKIGLNKTYHIKTYGCQMNEHDSEILKQMCEDLGYIYIDVMEEADLIILNTCAIRENAHNKVFGMIGRVKHLKETKNPTLVICGCMPQEESVAQEILKKHKCVDLVFGTHNINKFPKLLTELENKKNIIEVYSKEGEVIEGLCYKRDSKYKSWINIMYGCDKFCTYCIVPFTRGKERSRKKEDILKEIKLLIEDGVLEITLLGQNVNAYGKDLYDDYEFAYLLEDVAKTGVRRIKFVTSHPWDFTDKMIEVISKYDNILPFIHLPIQSGSDKILKSMGRKYSVLEYKTLFNKIKNKIKNVSITTDIIVGFPNETDEDFEGTLNIYNELQFDLAYTFIYSKREGTPAAKFKDPILEETKKDRLQELNKLVDKYAILYNNNMIDKVYSVLIEGISFKNENYMSGYTENNKLVNIEYDEKYIGKIVNVKITKANTWNLYGDIEK